MPPIMITKGGASQASAVLIKIWGTAGGGGAHVSTNGGNGGDCGILTLDGGLLVGMAREAAAVAELVKMEPLAKVCRAGAEARRAPAALVAAGKADQPFRAATRSEAVIAVEAVAEPDTSVAKVLPVEVAAVARMEPIRVVRVAPAS